MRDLVHRYLDCKLSRRGFLEGMTGLGFTLAAAEAVLEPLEAAEQAESPGATTIEGTGGELLLAQARAAGVEYIFTNPGSFEAGFFDALVDKPGVQLIVGLHEGVVAAMADGYHRVSGKPAFVNVHVMAGTAQMAGQLVNSSWDGSALVITAGLLDNQLWSDDVPMAARPGFDQKEVVRQFTKISWEARQAESLPLLLRRAFKVATTEPGGPVYLAMAQDALEKKGARAQVLPAERFLLRSRPRPAADSVMVAARRILEARRPLVLVGDEVWKSGAQSELVAFSEHLGLPVMTMPPMFFPSQLAVPLTAFGNFPTRHPHACGSFAMDSEWVERGVDLLVCVGARDFGGRTIPTRPEAPAAPVIRIGMNTAAMSRTGATDVALVGDVRESLKELREAVASLATKQRLSAVAAERSHEIRTYTASARARFEAAARANFGRIPIHPDEVGAVMARTLARDTILVCEIPLGNYGDFAFGYREDEPMWIAWSGGSLGWGVGAAAGAKLAAPNRPVVCSIGDGSLMYSAAGFWTQVRYGIPVLTVVWNNRNYETVRVSFHRYKGRMAASGHYPGTYLGDPDIDFVKLAESQGVKGEKAAGTEQLESALRRGMAATREGQPYLVEVATARFGSGADSTWHGSFNLAAQRKRPV